MTDSLNPNGLGTPPPPGQAALFAAGRVSPQIPVGNLKCENPSVEKERFFGEEREPIRDTVRAPLGDPYSRADDVGTTERQARPPMERCVFGASPLSYFVRIFYCPSARQDSLAFIRSSTDFHLASEFTALPSPRTIRNYCTFINDPGIAFLLQEYASSFRRMFPKAFRPSSQ